MTVIQRVLRGVQGTQKKTCGLSCLGLLLLGAAGTQLPAGEARAARCTNLAFTVNLNQTEVNVVGGKVGDEITRMLPQLISGTCQGSSINALNSTILFSVAANNTCSTAQLVVGVSDNQNIVSTNCASGRAGLFTGPAIGVYVPNAVGWPIYLKQKVPGKTVINLNSMTNGFSQIWTAGNSFGTLPQLEQASVVNNTSTITLIYTPTCSASVDDVIFPGTTTPSAIAAGTITPQNTTVRVQCDDILPKYSIRVSSPRGTHGNAANGVIKRDNPTVGYYLNWAQGQVAAANSPVQLDTVLTPVTKPTAASFNIPVAVKPVALVPQGDIQSGPANSAIQVDLTFN